MFVINTVLFIISTFIASFLSITILSSAVNLFETAKIFHSAGASLDLIKYSKNWSVLTSFCSRILSAEFFTVKNTVEFICPPVWSCRIALTFKEVPGRIV